MTALHVAAEWAYRDVVKVLIQNGADVNAFDERKRTALHFAVKGMAFSYGDGPLRMRDVVKVLIQNGADVNAVTAGKMTALHYAIECEECDIRFILQLLCFGAEIHELDEHDETDTTLILGQIYNRLKLLREGNRIGTTLMSHEEKRFMWNLAFFFTIEHGGAFAFKTYYTIRSYITFHGIFMAHGYDLGEGSIWRIILQSEEDSDW